MVLDSFKHDQQSIAFQSTAYPGVVYNKNDAAFVTTLWTWPTRASRAR